MKCKSLILIAAFILVSSSVLAVDEGEELKNLLASEHEYMSQPVKANVNLIKNATTRTRLETFCGTCTEVTKTVSMGVGGKMMRKECSDHHCTSLCPVAKLPEICKGS